MKRSTMSKILVFILVLCMILPLISYFASVSYTHLTKDKKADIRVLDMPLLDTTLSKDILGTFIADLVLQVLSFCAHEERTNIKQRQREGIEAAKKRGVIFGRRPLSLPDDFQYVVDAFNKKELSEREAITHLHISRTSFYKYKKEYRE